MVAQPQYNMNWAATAQEQAAYTAARVATDKVRTPGWWKFDQIVHSGINGVLNIAASVWMANDRANYEINQARYHNASNNFTECDFSTENEGPRRTYLDKIPVPLANTLNLENKTFNFYGLSDWIDRQFYNLSEDKKTGELSLKENTIGRDYNAIEERGGIFGMAEQGILGKIPVVKNVLGPLGKYFGGILFLAWGGHITNSVMWLMESPIIKPKAIKFLDKYISDPIRRFNGEHISEAEMLERAEIYKKLDGELRGKSLKGVWGARFAGILSIITFASVSEAIDKAIDNKFFKEKRHTRQEAAGQDITNPDYGILRVTQLFYGFARFVQGGLNGVGVEWNPDFLKKVKPGEKETAKSRKAKYMAAQTAVEMTGTGFTALIQYIFLMGKELFNVGFDTNVKTDFAFSNNAAKQSTKPRPVGIKIDHQAAVDAVLQRNGLSDETKEKPARPQGIKISADAQEKLREKLKEQAEKGYSKRTQPQWEDYKQKVSKDEETLVEQGV